MALNIIIIVSGAILLPFLLYYEYRENPKAILPIKTALSTLFVITVLIQPHPISAYYHLLLLLGLLFCLGGDVFLALPQSKMFLLGLVSFLIGHIFYIIGFYCIHLQWVRILLAQTPSWDHEGTGPCIHNRHHHDAFGGLVGFGRI